MKRFKGLWRSHEDNTLRRLLDRPLEEFGLQDNTSEDEVLKRQLEATLLVKELQASQK